jgi:dUTPase
MALQTATNPQTGQRLALINGQWVPFTESATNPQTGEKAVLVNGQWITSGQTTAQQPTSPKEESGFLRQTLDVPVQVASGIATGVRLITDSFGADNPVSQNIRGVEGFLQNLLSAQAKNDQQEIARIMKAAEDQGVGANLRAAVEAFATAPVDLIAQAAGTAVPTIAGGLAAQALKAPALLASTGVGAVMGAGTVKSSIYDEVKQTLTDLGASPEEAEKKAVLAQEYGGENLDQILLGTVIGGAAGRFGIEPAVAKQLAGNIAQKSVLKAGIQEAAPEAVQAAQEQVAQNIALQREGVDVPTFRGAVGAGALEAIAGGALGAGVEAVRPEVAPPVETTEEPPPPPADEQVTPPPAPSEAQTQLLADMEEADEGAADEERKKFEAVVQKVTEGEAATAGAALDIARDRVQKTGKTAAPYIMNAVNAQLPEGMTPITMSQASQIRRQLVNEGIIEGKDKVRKAAPVEPTVEPAEDEVVSYDDLERRQVEAAVQPVKEEAKDVGTADAETTAETKPPRTRTRAAAPVSGKPLTDSGINTLAEGQVASETVGRGVDTAGDPAEGSVTREERSAAPLKEEPSVETPYDRYQSLQRRLEGLISARRIAPIQGNRLRTQLRQADPVKSPETYAPILDQTEKIIDQYERYAEEVEAGDSVQSINLREQRLKAQEQNALQRAQRQIEQNKIAEALKDRRARTEYDEETLPKYAQDMRDAMDRGSIKPVTQLLVDPRAAADVYPGVQNLKFRELFQTVAKRINDTDFSNVSVQTEATVGADIERFKRLKDEAKYAEYDPSNNTLYMRRDRIYAGVVLHEMVHAGTAEVIRRYEIDGLARETKQAKEQLALAEKVGDKEERKKAVEKAKARVEEVELQKLGVQRLMNVYELVQTQGSDVSLIREFPAAFENLYEFIAIGLSNPQFQNRLARIEIPLTIGRKNMWTEFVKAIGNLFGYNVKTKDGVTALDEVGQAFSEILSAPSKEGVTGLKPLAAKKAEGEPKPPIDPVEEARKKRELIMGEKLTVKGLLQDRLKAKNSTNVIKQIQDRQRYLYELQRDMDRAEVANWMPASQGGNTLAAANDESAGKYENNEKVVMPLIENLNKAIRAYAAKKGLSVDGASDLLNAYFTSEANQARRITNYIKEKPLKTKPMIRLKGSDKLISYAQYRDMLIDSVLTEQELDDATREAIYSRLMQLVGLEIGPDGKPKRTKDAAKYEDPLGASYSQLDNKRQPFKPSKRELDFFHPYYDNIKGYGYKTDEAMVNKMEADMATNGAEIKAVKKAMQELDNAAQRFNQDATHLTQPAKNLIKLYGWGDKYVPLMGKVRSETGNRDQFIYMNTVPNEMIRAFRGRADAPDSPIIMTMVNAGKAAARNARSEIIPTLVNLMKPARNGKQYVKGEMVGTITFKDRFKGEINFEEADGKGGKKWVGQDKFYNHLPNGDIEVWQVNDPEVVQALRPDWEPTKTVFPRLQQYSQFFTSIVGQGHTRYQLKFAPYDFPRNVFANAGIMMAELSPIGGLKYISDVGTEVFKGRLPQMWRLSKYHSNNDWESIRRMGGYNAKTGQWKDPFIRDAYRYLERGGKISVIRSWQAKEKLEQLIELANKGSARQQFEAKIAAANAIFDRWLDMFDFVARVQAYRAAKSYAENVRGLTDEASELYGVNYAKNLANFEKKGLMRWPNAMYAFWGPAATGAVRAMDAIAPALRLTAPRVVGGTRIEAVIDELPEEIKSDPQAAAKYMENYQKQKTNGLFAMAFFTGVGFVAYNIARSLGSLVKDAFDDEEEPKNPIAEDSKELWTRNMRIPLEWLDIPGLKDKYLQIPWGFGVGSFGAMGAQIAALGYGDQSKLEFLGNTATIAADSYLPLPVARYNPFDESLFTWASSSLLPTLIRPMYELNVNVSGLGHRISRSYYNKYGPAYAGSENIEEIYRDAALLIRDISMGEYMPEPNEIRYITTAYFDGVAAILADSYNWMLLSGGAKDFDPKTDLIVLDNFIGNKIRPSVPKYQEANKELDKFKEKYDSFVNDPDPARAAEFRAKYPNADAIVAMYNRHISNVNQFRKITTYEEVHADSPRERKRVKEMNDDNRDVLMNQITSLYETFKDEIN